MSTQVVNNVSDLYLNRRRIAATLDHCCAWLGLAEFEWTLTFVSDAEIQRYNHEFRQIDKPTDVLSFPQLNWTQRVKCGEAAEHRRLPGGPPLSLGDVLVSPSTAQKNADGLGHTLSRELCFLAIHGLLHLCGHDHIDAQDERLMLAQQRELFARLGKDGAEPWLAWTGRPGRTFGRQSGRSELDYV